MNKPLLIAYPPGARGDFLASVLLDLPDNSLQESTVRSWIGVQSFSGISDTIMHYTYNNREYYKVHAADNLTQELMDRCLSIKINVPTGTEQDIIAKLMRAKQLPYVPGGNAARQAIDQVVVGFQPWRFDYTINFRDLFEINYITAIYKQITGQELTPARLAVIEHNIELQYQFLTAAERHYVSGRS